jgi:hypothetical protein
MNDITLDSVLNSKVYVHEKSQISFGSPRQYIEPFLEKFVNLGVNFRVDVSDRVANKEADSGKTNEAFGRVLIEAKFPAQYCAHDHDSVIGMVYALDLQKPVIKIYSGENAWACTNLAIFGGRYIHQVEILSGYQSVYDKGLEYVDGLTQQLARFQQLYERMNDTVYEGDDINRIIGFLLRQGYSNKQIGTTPVLSALKDLEDNKSRYAIRENKTSQWNLYSALTQYCTSKVDILEKASKTVMLSNLFVQEA